MKTLIAMMKHETNTFSPIITDWNRFKEWGAHLGDEIPKIFKDTNKSYEKLLDDTIEGIKSYVKDVNTNKFPTKSNIVEIKDEEFDKFLNKVG